LARGCAER